MTFVIHDFQSPFHKIVYERQFNHTLEHQSSAAFGKVYVLEHRISEGMNSR